VKQQDLSKAKNPDIRNSLAAMERAAAEARKIAIQTNTAIVVVGDGKTVRITAEQLRAGEG
jgi:sensor histidine kinase regulating citrate/malate metabolism